MIVEIPERLKLARERIASDRLELPGGAIELFALPDLAAKQTEYQKHPKWRAHWLAIGIDLSVRDPLFINVKDAALPVLTWMADIDPEPWAVAATVEAFIDSLLLAQTKAEPQAILEQIDERNEGAVDLDFWECLLNLVPEA